MPDAQALQPYLDPLPLSAWQFHPVATSTNDLALAWARDGAPDGALVLADAQTRGRGRGERRWVTRPGVALAFSLILRPTIQEAACISRFTALAALGLVDALGKLGLQADIKWPNDVLLAGGKVAGVLVEADWQGEGLKALVVGMGVNVTPAAVPPAESLRYPAACVQEALGNPLNRWALLAEVIRAMLAYREILSEPAFVDLWNEYLAFRGEWIHFRLHDGEIRKLKVLGVLPDGRLQLETGDGEMLEALSGEIEMTYNRA